MHRTGRTTGKSALGRALTVALALCVGVAGTLMAHDMFLKLTSYFVAENSGLTIPLINGTFSTSENSIDRNRIADISMVSPAGRERLDTSTVTGRGDSTFFAARTGSAGTYVFGVSTRPNVLKMSGKQFNEYLEEEGIHEVLATRKQAGAPGLADSVSERYSKHVKALIQVGAAPSEGYGTVLGYAAELVPLGNPYTLKPGATLRVKALVHDAATAGLTLLAGGRGAGGTRLPVQSVRTGADGIATIRLARAGVYYVKFVSMVKKTGADVNYESNWATMTFQVR